MSWYYLSYAVPGKFMGAVILEADNEEHAAVRARKEGWAREGSILICRFGACGEKLPHARYLNRTLTREDVMAIWPDALSTGEARRKGLEPNPDLYEYICEKCAAGLPHEH